MKTRMTAFLIVLIAAAMVLSVATPGLTQPVVPNTADRLYQDAAGAIEIIWNPQTQRPSFVRGALPVPTHAASEQQDATASATAFMTEYADVFGISNVAQELRVAVVRTDTLAMTHVTYRQIYAGVEVYRGEVKLHLAADGQTVVAVSSSFIPGITLDTVQPQLTAEEAVGIARQAMPNGVVSQQPRLVVYRSLSIPNSKARLAWVLELRDTTLPARHLYMIDAINGQYLDVLENLPIHRVKPVSTVNISPVSSRHHFSWRNVFQPAMQGPLAAGQADLRTYDAEHSHTLPGTLVRSNDEPPTGDGDVDQAHEFARATYDFYWSAFGRDSFDNLGATLISTANYGDNYANAFWDGTQMVYGDNFPVRDVVAHELTHAVTERTAALEYRWQSGALNESFSDIFGAMVDRDDWLMGEDLPSSALGGREAIRDLEDPTRFGQPAHTDDWVETCSDNEGVHTNSGITNKAYYNSATTIGKAAAERIFYRTLITYLGVSSSLEDARAGALQAATDLYGSNSSEYAGLEAGFAAVGLDGSWSPDANSCTCAASAALAATPASADRPSLTEVASTLYQVRDQLLTGVAGEHYRTLYYAYTGRISYLLLWDTELRATGARLLQDFTPGLQGLLSADAPANVVTAENVGVVLTFLHNLADEDRQQGGGELADVIDREIVRIEWDRLIGMTFSEAWTYIQARIETPVTNIYLPAITR